MEGVKLNLNMLDYRGNRTADGYESGKKRGGYPYIPPFGWKAFGLKVLNLFDNGNNDWLEKNNNPNEWAVAYHGIGRLSPEPEVITNIIINGGFKPGSCQVLANYEDDNHPGCKIGIGVYCTPDINYTDKIINCVGKSKTEINGKKFKMVFMLRVKPDRIRFNHTNPNEWILNGTTEEMRPYRILLKEV